MVRRDLGKQPFYTIQDQAFPKKVADQYFAIQSDVLQGQDHPGRGCKADAERSLGLGEELRTGDEHGNS